MLFEISSLPRLGVSVVELPKSSVPDMSSKARFRVLVGGTAASATTRVQEGLLVRALLRSQQFWQR
jgi:hypothetical protein